MTWLDIFLRIIAIMALFAFLSFCVVFSIVVISYALNDRKEQKK